MLHRDYRELVEDYRFKNVFSDIHRRHYKESAWEILDLWYHNAQAFSTQAMRTASESIYSRWEGILAWYDKSINNGFAEAVNNIQTTRRMIREFRNIAYFIAMVHLCNNGLEISFD